MAEEDFHPVVQLLLARMETNPEEFDSGAGFGRWGRLLDEVRTVANEEEKQSLMTRFSRIRLDALHQRMMQQLLEPEPVLDARGPGTRITVQQDAYAPMQRTTDQSSLLSGSGLLESYP